MNLISLSTPINPQFWVKTHAPALPGGGLALPVPLRDTGVHAATQHTNTNPGGQR